MTRGNRFKQGIKMNEVIKAMKKSFCLGFAMFVLMCLSIIPAVAQSSKVEAPTLDPEDEQQVLSICDLQKTNPEEADETFLKMLRRARDKEKVTAMGRLFLEKNVYPYAKMCADKAYEIDAQYIPGLMLFGDVCIMRKDWGTAGQKFDEVLMVDSTYTEAILRNVQVYKFVNPIAAKDMLQRLKRLEPNNYEADKQLGDICYGLDDYKEAAAAYAAYYAGVQEPDLNAVENYVLSLYASQDFAKALEVANAALAKDAKNLNLRRMKFYNLYETKDYQGASVAMDYFNPGEYPDSMYTYRDYNYRGLTFEQMKDYSSALQAFTKAIELNPSAAAVYKSLSNIYSKMGMMDEAISNYQTYIDSLGTRAELTDLFGLGRLYYTGLTKGVDSVKAVSYAQEGDKVFAKISVEAPSSYLGPLWRARINNALDSRTPNDSVYAYYQETVKRLEGKDDKAAESEAYSYFAWYALQKDDEANALKYSELLLSLDPANTMAQQIKKYFEAKSRLK